MGRYTDSAAVAQYLGRTLTTAQIAQCDSVVAAAEAYVDRTTRRSWMQGAITNERYDLIRDVLILTQRPVWSVTSVSVRTTQVGDTPVLLTAGTDYELLDATRGEIRFVLGYHGRNLIALVSYLPNRPVPDDISFATTVIAGSSLAMTLFPDRWGITGAHGDGQVQVQYDESGQNLHIPQQALAILERYRLPMIV